MNKKLQSIIGVIILLGSIGLVAYGGYLLLIKLKAIFSTVDPKLGAGLIAAFATIMVSLISVLVSKHLERKSEILSQLREKKIPTYEKMMHFMFSMTMADKLGKKKLSAIEKQAVLTEIVQELIIWGSDEMLDAFYNFRNETVQNSKNTAEGTGDAVGKGLPMLCLIEDILIAIRKDLGHKNKGVHRGKILGLFITDFAKLVK